MAHDKRQSGWLEFYNRVLYNRFASLYAALDWLTLGVWWQLLSRALDYMPEKNRILEVGFGPGKLHVELVQRSEICVGLDMARGMCRLTQRRLASVGLTSLLTQGDMQALPYPDGAFDALVSTFALPGVPDGLRAVQEMARVVKADGRIVLVDVGLPADGNRFGTFWARLWKQMGGILHDHPSLFEQTGLAIRDYAEFGPGKHIRVMVGEKKTG